MKEIHLVDTRGFEVGAGIILAMSTGIVFSNQCGGMSCAHPKLEGVFFPAPNVDLPHDDRLCWGGGKIPESYAKTLDKLFEAHGLPVEVDCEREGMECWIPILVKQNNHEMWRQFIGYVGVYTTADNCD